MTIADLVTAIASAPDRVDLRHQLIKLYLERGDDEAMRLAAEQLSIVRLMS